MTSRRRGRPSLAPTTPATPDFVPGELFDFKSPKGVMTRARRSSIYGTQKPSATLLPSRRMSAMPTLNEVKDGRIQKRNTTTRKTVAKNAKTAAAAAVGARTNARSSNRGRARAAGSRTASGIPRAQVKVEAHVKLEVTPPKKTGAQKTSTAKKASTAKKVAPAKKRNSSELDDSLFKDVKVVLQKLEQTPAKEVSPDVVFERLEEVKRSPLRVDLVCRDLIKESTDSEEEVVEIKQKKKTKTPASKRNLAMAQRMTRSARKQMPPPSPVKANVFAPAPERRPLSPKKQPNFDSNLAPSSMSTGTPQGVNPMAMLKNNLRQQVKQKMEERIARMPTSPYALLEGETETGSPEYAFTKLVAPKSMGRKSSGISAALPPAAKYLTNTPLVGQNKRRILDTVDENRRSFDKADTPLKSTVVRRLDVSDLETEDETEVDGENVAPTSPIMPRGLQQPELITGSLANCVVM